MKKHKLEGIKGERKWLITLGKKERRLLVAYSICILFLQLRDMEVFAEGDPITIVNNLSKFIFSLIRTIIIILFVVGLVQIGLSLKSHGLSQRANGFLKLVEGVIITFAKAILNLLAG